MRSIHSGAFVLAALCALAGCHNQPASNEPLAGSKVEGSAGKVKVINGWCPVMDEHPVVGMMARPDAVRDYKGAKVGFCCDDCPAQWDAMSTAEKDAALAKARAKAPMKP